MNRIQRDESRKHQANGMFHKKHDTGKGWTVLAVLCIIAAIVCFAFEPIKTYLVQSYRPTVSRQAIAHQQPKHANYNFSQAHPITMRQILKARLTGKIDTAGEMLVPGQIHLPIGLGVSNTTLALAAGTMRANDRMGHGNYALAGHHMLNKHALFTPLYYHASVGTDVYLTDLKHVYVYKVYQRKMISPHNVQVANETRKPILTLITCNDSGSRRLMIRGGLVKKMSLQRSPAGLKRQFKQKMNNYNVFAGYHLG